jgi:hypothetical protein
MTEQTNNDTKILDLAADVRKFEIGLFWQRSLFFWGFIGAAFVSYAALMKDNADKDLPLAIACFGLVCSVAWTLVNRGSKYWQEYWENEVEQIEEKALGQVLFGKEGKVQRKGWGWLQARRYSVSKLAIALSDFTILVWLVLMAKAASWSIFPSCMVPSVVMPISAICYVILVLFAGRSTRRGKQDTRQNSS